MKQIIIVKYYLVIIEINELENALNELKKCKILNLKIQINNK